MLISRTAAAAVLVLALTGHTTAQGTACPGSGLSLLVTGGRLGDAFAITVTGAPGAAGLLGIDIGGGPVATPIGTICLSFTPFLTTVPFTLDAGGNSVIGGVLPPDPAVSGLTIFLQAGAALGPGVPSLSPGASVTFRPPRWFFLDPGTATPFGTTPGRICSFDALTDTAGWTASLTTTATDITRVPFLATIGVLMSNGSLSAFDENTGAPVLNAPLPSGPGVPSRIVPFEDGSGLIVLYPGVSPSPFGPGTPGAVFRIALPVPTLLSSFSLTSGNPQDMIAIPGLGIAYLIEGSSIIPFNYVNGTQFPPVSFGTAYGSITDWLVDGNRLVLLLGGTATSLFGGPTPISALQAIDTATHLPLLPSPVSLGRGNASVFRKGPSPSGESFYALMPLEGQIVRIAPDLSATQGTIPVPTGTGGLELSPGGTEWLLLRSGTLTPFGSSPGTLLVMNATTLLVTTVAPLPSEPQAAILPLPSDALRKAYIVSNANTLLPIATDPATPPGLPILLPFPVTVPPALGNRP